jgi:guanylate kinase
MTPKTDKSVRSILNNLYQDANAVEDFDPVIANGEVDIALTQLAEWIEGEKEFPEDTYRREILNATLDHLIEKLRNK